MKRIELQNVNFEYKGGKPVFSGLNLCLESGQGQGHCTAIMGASGSGKSTLLKLLLGIEMAKTGTLSMKPADPVISYVPQEPVLFEHLSPKRNARYFEFAGAYQHRFDESLYFGLMHSLGLKEVIENAKSVTAISGGQKQRLSLLRALSINPDFILLDEPCNGLDAEVKRNFLNKLREITEQYGLFVLYITHHKLESQLIADDIAYLVQDISSGVVHQAVKSTVKDFIHRPPVLEAAHVFRFPDVKVLPVSKLANGTVTIANDSKSTTHYWLIDDQDIGFTDEGWKFKVVAKSPVYATIRHEPSQIDWMMPSELLNGQPVGGIVNLNFRDDVLEYDENGLLIKR